MEPAGLFHRAHEPALENTVLRLASLGCLNHRSDNRGILLVRMDTNDGSSSLEGRTASTLPSVLGVRHRFRGLLTTATLRDGLKSALVD